MFLQAWGAMTEGSRLDAQAFYHSEDLITYITFDFAGGRPLQP